MFHHVTVGCTDLARASAFYRAVLAPLGLKERPTEPDGGPPMAAFALPGQTRPTVFISLPFDGNPATAGNGSMLAFAAPTRAAVDAAYAAALAHGGTDEGAPGLRPHYASDYYGAYVRDTDGNKLHMVHRDPPGATTG